MTTVQAAKAIKKHLLKYWDEAETWKDDNPRLWAGSMCLVTLKPDDVPYDYYEYHMPLDGSLLGLFKEDGKEAVLQYLDFLILGNVENA